MSWYASLAASPTQPLPNGTAGLILVDPTAGAIAATLPPVLGANTLYLVRLDASPNLATFTPAAQDNISPAGVEAPALVLRAGDCITLVPGSQRTWLRRESGLGVAIREATVAALVAYNTLAGAAVESERVDGVAAGDMPRLFVYADEDAESVGGGGTAPAFDVTMNLVVQALVENARQPDARTNLDTLMMQARDCLLGDPVWVSLSAQVKSLRTTRTFKAQQNQIVGDGRMQIALAWTEIIRPRVTTPLSLVTLATTPAAGTRPVTVQLSLPPT